jgi:putative ABC transport system permease protein
MRPHLVQGWIWLICVFIGGCSEGGWVAGHIRPGDTYRTETMELSANGSSRNIQVGVVTSEFFPAVNVQPLIGRLFLLDEHDPGKDLVVVASRRFWQEQLAGNPAWSGKTLRLNRRDFTLVGVMPSGFAAPPGTDVWIPAATQAAH